MKRKQLFEFEDFAWLPSTLRSTMTKLITVLYRVMNAPAVISSQISTLKNECDFDQIVDLGSGSGGAMPSVIKTLNETLERKVKLILTDRHPNQEFVDLFNEGTDENAQYLAESVDARTLENAPTGLLTMISSFHHMPPESATRILGSAQEKNQPIMIYEITKNNIPFIIWLFLLPLSLTIVAVMAIVFLPFVRPLGWKDVLFTWIVPIVPLLYAWDGQASLPRTYSFKDINELLPSNTENYRWEVKDAINSRGLKQGYFVIGLPVTIKSS